MSNRGQDNRTLADMMQDQLVLDRMESWGEWDFLAKDVPVEKDDIQASYDVLTIDLDNRRIQADVIGYDNVLERVVHDAVEAMENDYGYIVPHLASENIFGGDFPPQQVKGNLYWTEEDSWKLETSEFDSLSDNLFGYDILSRDYQRISPDVI